MKENESTVRFVQELWGEKGIRYNSNCPPVNKILEVLLTDYYERIDALRKSELCEEISECIEDVVEAMQETPKKRGRKPA